MALVWEAEAGDGVPSVQPRLFLLSQASRCPESEKISVPGWWGQDKVSAPASLFSWHGSFMPTHLPQCSVLESAA